MARLPITVDAGTMHDIKQHLARAGKDSVLHKVAKPGKPRGHPEHDAQVRFYEKLEEAAKTARGLGCDLDEVLPIIHAIPQFTMEVREKWKAKRRGAEYKAEGQRKGMPDNHIPLGMTSSYTHGPILSLYIELKFKSYPSSEQVSQARRLAKYGNAVLVIRKPDVELLSDMALETVLRYLEGRDDFAEFSHPSYTFLP